MYGRKDDMIFCMANEEKICLTLTWCDEDGGVWKMSGCTGFWGGQIGLKLHSEWFGTPVSTWT